MSSTPGIGPQLDPQPLQEPVQPSARTRWIDLGLVLLVSFWESILFAVYALLHPQYYTSPSDGSAIGLTYLLLHESIGIVVLAYVLSRQRRSMQSIGISLRWSDPFKAIGLMIVSTAIVGGLHSFVRYVDQAFGIVPDTRTVPQAAWKQHSITGFIHGISSPIFEEVLVRGYLMTEIIELGKPSGWAIAASVILQTSYHVYYGLGTAISLSGIFLVFAAYFSKSRRLMPVLLAHLFWDQIAYFIH
jgi:membrane protease YdiL (CAAX protease family)